MAKEKCIEIETSVFVRLDKAHLFAPDQESGKYSARIVIRKSDQKTIGRIQDGCDEIVLPLMMSERLWDCLSRSWGPARTFSVISASPARLLKQTAGVHAIFHWMTR